ncbi:RNA pyrophosphohydrolase [Rhodobacter capsulatus]|uniref:RNA pyrophosphohydrolase n=1 Tax=Rhodobacter capsulatus TaxID=1061 RepID=UPI0003D30B6B|nr:RNA pyrophosphohydrolase [Rhodobacter capsulatus]ETD82659.1 RNA pyrophosphohydrolase [Rhodobacter capsulatus YW1]
MTPEELAALPYRKNVGLVLINAEGLIFAGQRIDSPGHAWQMPQGGIDAGERPKEAALRELQEETGVRPELVEKLAKTEDWLVYDLPEELIGTIWGGKYRGQKQKWFLFRFLGQDSDVNIATEHPEFSVWRWMEPAELVEKIVPFKRAVYEQVFDSFAEHLKK